jgi:flagellar assembly factor FliW
MKMMLEKINSPTVGEIEFEDSSVIRFPEGMLGLPAYKRFLLLESPDLRPLLRLQCVDEPTISFLVIDPTVVDPGFREYVESVDKGNNVLTEGDGSVLLAVCRIAKDGQDVTANLVAPVVINQKSREGQQFVLLDSPYDVRHSLAQMSERKEA